jgi:hypothetical protein
MFYGVVILTKLDVCAYVPEGTIGKILDRENLKLLPYLNALLKTLQAASGREKFSVPETFLSIITRLAAWYQRQHIQVQPSRNVDELLEPMANLSSIQDLENVTKDSGSSVMSSGSTSADIGFSTATQMAPLGYSNGLASYSYEDPTAWVQQSLQYPESGIGPQTSASFDPYAITMDQSFENSAWLAFADELGGGPYTL